MKTFFFATQRIQAVRSVLFFLQPAVQLCEGLINELMLVVFRVIETDMSGLYICRCIRV